MLLNQYLWNKSNYRAFMPFDQPEIFHSGSLNVASLRTVYSRRLGIVNLCFSIVSAATNIIYGVSSCDGIYRICQENLCIRHNADS